MKLEQMRLVGMRVVEAMAPGCERISIAGSVRRRKAEPKDLEIVYIAQMVERRKDLFTAEVVPATEGLVIELMASGFWRLDTEVKRNGPLYKRMVMRASSRGPDEVVVELFRAEVGNWGLQLALRTGPAEFNHLLVTPRSQRGAMPAGMRMAGGWLWRGEERLESGTEEEFFGQVGVPCWEPGERSEERLEEWLREQR